MKYFIIIAIIAMSLFSCSEEVVEPAKPGDSVDLTYNLDESMNETDDKERGITIDTTR